MSAIAAIFRRDRGPVSERVLGRLADALAHRGPDGRDRRIEVSAGLEHLHHWVTPEEVGERQPLVRGGRLLAFDGRIDNRSELLESLNPASPGPDLSDAELVLAAHELWGDGFCRRLVGPYALVLYELETRRGLLARDALGDRTLFYRVAGRELVVGSEEACLLAHPGVSLTLDESRLLHYFAASVPESGATFFEDVTELTPGTVLRFDDESITTERFWSPPSDRIGRSSPAELAERYRELLRRAVASRRRAPFGTGILMSGGLDSTSIAALAAESAELSGERLPCAISWVFDRFAECDERKHIQLVIERSGLERLQFAADDLGPLPEGSDLCLNPSSPEENPYRRLKARAYAEAARAGCRALLGGGSADALYAGRSAWLADLARDRGAGVAASELFREIGRLGIFQALRRAGFGALVRPLRRRRRAPEWLTPWARRELLEERPPSEPSRRTLREAAVAGARPARGVSLERFHAATAGVDLRHPYRDLRLVEFMLSLPAYELHRHGRPKEIARRALAGTLPERIRTRTAPTSLTPLFDHALRGPNRSAWLALLDAKGALWPRYVRRSWVEAALRESASPAGDVALWCCASLELWRRRFGL